MENHNKSVIVITLIVIAAVSTVLITTQSHSEDNSALSKTIDSSGNIRLPDIDFRKEWTALGSWAVAADEGTLGSKGIHMVYTQPETVDAYRKTGKFPDGAILVKELLGAETTDMTTGTISRAGGIEGWFVMVKDSTGKFEKTNKLWGEGWGWAYFGADDRVQTTTTDYAAECLTCHIPAKDNDWIYTEGYPVLK